MSNTSSVVKRVVPFAVAFVTFGSVMTQAAFGWFPTLLPVKCPDTLCTNTVNCTRTEFPCCCKRAPNIFYVCECAPAGQDCPNGVGVNCRNAALPPIDGEGL